MRPYVDIDELDRLTPEVVASGTRIFTSHLFGAWAASSRSEKEEAHSHKLLQLVSPDHGAHICSMGCGIGQLESYWWGACPDLRFTLVNLSPVQLDMCPDGPAFNRVLADAEDSHLPADYYDMVLFHTSLVQMDAETALKEAYRIMRPGGRLVLCEMVRLEGDNDRWRELLAGEVLPLYEMNGLIQYAGFQDRHEKWLYSADDLHFRQMLDPKDQALLDDVSPFLIMARK